MPPVCQYSAKTPLSDLRLPLSFPSALTIAAFRCIIVKPKRKEVRAIKIYEYKKGEAIPGKRVVALGLFDGVHKGHRKIIECAVSEAKKKGLSSAVFTFCDDKRLKGGVRIYGAEEKYELIKSLGADEIIVAGFEDISDTSAEDFIKTVLVSELGSVLCVSGRDFRFGKGALGDALLLEKGMKSLGADSVCVSDVTEGRVKVSSSEIKRLLSLGEVKEAATLLSEPYFVIAEIKRGMGLGKTLGFPTVNTEVHEGCVSLMNGVYYTLAEINGKKYQSLTNVGRCPTVGERKIHRETYIMDFVGEIYGGRVKISFIEFLRPEIKFSSVEELKKQIKVDVDAVVGKTEGDFYARKLD